MVSKTVEASFPSNIERTVASALLHLSSFPSIGSRRDSGDSESFESSEFSTSISGGSLVSEASVDAESPRSQQLTVVAFVSGLHDLKLKIVRKKRTKSICISTGKKLKSNKAEPTPDPASSESVSEITTEASSCLSSSSTAQSFSSETNALRNAVMPRHIGHRAAAIIRILSEGSASEVKIRQLLGDSPSTSKALRMLLKQQEVKRYGAGGRADPYTYMIA